MKYPIFVCVPNPHLYCFLSACCFTVCAATRKRNKRGYLFSLFLFPHGCVDYVRLLQK